MALPPKINRDDRDEKNQLIINKYPTPLNETDTSFDNDTVTDTRNQTIFH